jgi:aryl-alcohol dehydrogenase-like predicted oxidoreductase
MGVQENRLRQTANEVRPYERRSRGEDEAVTRREFFEWAVAATVATGVGQNSWAAETKQGLPYRTLGRTGEKVSLIGLGGFHLGKPNVDEQESIRIVRTAIDNGINFLDNCWDYNGGASEMRMGRALRDGYREKVFLMTKIDGRDRKTAAQQADESLRRLQTDRIDLLQIHEVIRLSDPNRVLGTGRRTGGAVGCPKGRQDPLHRFHGT